MILKLSNDNLALCQFFEQITGMIPFGCEIIENKMKRRVVFFFKSNFKIEMLGTIRRQLTKNWIFSYPFEIIALHKQVEEFLRIFLFPIKILDLNTEKNGNEIIMTLRVPYEDRGKVIGKEGNRINCLRKLLTQYYRINKFILN